MKKIKIFPLILIICLALCALAPAAYAIDDPQLGAQAVYLADMNTDEVLYEKNADEQRSPASLTKIMTGLLAIEAVESGQCSMDDIVTAGADAWYGMAEDSSNSNIQPGEMMTYRDLVYCAVVHSANEACNILATYISGSISAFVDRMNQRAAELGCTNTHFLDPNGLSNDGHYTTARDLYYITKEAVKHPDFLTICDTEYYKTQPTNMSEAREIWNSNALISNGGYYASMSMQNNGHDYLYEGAAGVKTGYTRAAGYCLVSTATVASDRLRQRRCDSGAIPGSFATAAIAFVTDEYEERDSASSLTAFALNSGVYRAPFAMVPSSPIESEEIRNKNQFISRGSELITVPWTGEITFVHTFGHYHRTSSSHVVRRVRALEADEERGLSKEKCVLNPGWGLLPSCVLGCN